jgi:hypothetical protein
MARKIRPRNVCERPEKHYVSAISGPPASLREAKQSTAIQAEEWIASSLRSSQ